MSDQHTRDHHGASEENLAEFAAELRLLAEAVLERVEPVLRKTAADGRAEWSSCAWCPVCAAAALLRGEHHDVVAAIADHGTALVTVLREALAGVPVEPIIPPEVDPDSPEYAGAHRHSWSERGAGPEGGAEYTGHPGAAPGAWTEGMAGAPGADPGAPEPDSASRSDAAAGRDAAAGADAATSSDGATDSGAATGPARGGFWSTVAANLRSPGRGSTRGDAASGGDAVSGRGAASGGDAASGRGAASGGDAASAGGAASGGDAASGGERTGGNPVGPTASAGSGGYGNAPGFGGAAGADPSATDRQHSYDETAQRIPTSSRTDWFTAAAGPSGGGPTASPGGVGSSTEPARPFAEPTRPEPATDGSRGADLGAQRTGYAAPPVSSAGFEMPGTGRISGSAGDDRSAPRPPNDNGGGRSAAPGAPRVQWQPGDPSAAPGPGHSPTGAEQAASAAGPVFGQAGGHRGTGRTGGPQITGQAGGNTGGPDVVRGSAAGDGGRGAVRGSAAGDGGRGAVRGRGGDTAVAGGPRGETGRDARRSAGESGREGVGRGQESGGRGQESGGRGQESGGRGQVSGSGVPSAGRGGAGAGRGVRGTGREGTARSGYVPISVTIKPPTT
ncbi:hypothetical protein [Nocardia sp. CC201C]|uniref:hypothetical protein n=1 Tax=Nocardia sp. CC201C TaxID=3044575 RepID=UPI0024A8420D|nr:hypothetical protein [Nocardia sp. CC201C]